MRIMAVRVVSCGYVDGAHLYRQAQLSDPAYEYLIPACQEDQPYPWRHDRQLIGPLLASPYCRRCVACDGWEHRNAGTVTVQRGCIDLQAALAAATPPDCGGQGSASVGAGISPPLAPTEVNQ